jgi:hypothetical protein
LVVCGGERFSVAGPFSSQCEPKIRGQHINFYSRVIHSGFRPVKSAFFKHFGKKASLFRDAFQQNFFLYIGAPEKIRSDVGGRCSICLVFGFSLAHGQLSLYVNAGLEDWFR